MASAFNAELVTVNTTEGGAFGAALLAGVSARRWGSVAEACGSCIKIMGSTQPDLADVNVYQESYAVYQGLYPSLANEFHKIGRLV